MSSKFISFGLPWLFLYTSGITAECLFGPTCKYACNCLQSATCDPMEGCPGNCAWGFDGPKCQRKNVALDTRTVQRPETYCQKPENGGKCLNASYAVDGILDTTIDFETKFCTHTNGAGNPSWTVHLNRTYGIYRFVIYNRDGHSPNEIYADRLRGFQIEVGIPSNLRQCYKDPTPFGSPGVIIKNHCKDNQPLFGNTIRITKDAAGALTLCEVLLHVCTDGWYREECDRECQSTDRCASCDNNNLTCTTCIAQRWGTDCDDQCFCAGDVSCNKTSGRCPGGCAAGYTGSSCSQACNSTSYGPGCGTLCGHCSIPGCNRFNGNCNASTPLCMAGFKGPMCKTACAGSFGPDCKTSCGKCAKGVNCDPVNGVCPDNDPRCAGGWMNTACLTRCPDNLYGPDCRESCGNCLNSDKSCQKEDGKCGVGCAAGWRGDVCKQECETGSWGENCASRCSEYCKGGNTACSIINGTCGMGCLPGGLGERCVTDQTTGAAPKTASIVGGVIGGIAVAAVVAVVVVVFMRRRKTNSEEKDLSQEMNSNTALYANVSDVGALDTEQSRDKTAEMPSKAVNNNPSDRQSEVSMPDKTPPKLLAKNKFKPVLELKGEDNSTYYNVVNFVKDGNNGIDVDDLAGHIAQMKIKKAFLAEYEALSTGDSNSEIASKTANRPKNRYRGILSYDHSRVVLKTLPEDPNSDYINASFLHGYKEPNKYIASQGPTPVMINDFVRMTWEQDVGKIIMLTNLTENTKIKSLAYWPDTVSNSKRFGQISVKLQSEEVFADYVIRSLEFAHADEPDVFKTVTQFHFTSWPDHGVPLSATGLLMFRDKIHATETEATGPLLVHCSAGVGRTGTYIGLDYLVKQANDEHQVDVVFCVNLMRSQRPKMIQTVEQYQFLYESVLEAIKGYEPSIPSADFEKAYRKMCQADPKTGETTLHEIFQSLKKSAPRICNDDYSAALDKDNKTKNRNLKVLAADRCRVYLSTPVKGRNNYINAVFIPGFKAKNTFIITQTPLPDTVVDFWRLLNDQLITTVITLDPPESFNSKQVGVYWPEEEDTFGPFVVRLTDFVEGKSFDVRTLDMYRGNEQTHVSKIKQYHCKFWPGTSSTLQHAGLFELLQDLQQWNEESSSESPILVHCLDGVSKSGMFCAVSSILEKMKIEQQVNIIHHVKEIQKNQPVAVSNFEDFKNLHEVVLEYLKSFQIYSNFT